MSPESDDRQIKRDKDGLPELTQFSEEGFVDFVFGITDLNFDDRGVCRIEAKAKHEKKIVGIGIGILPGMKPGIVNDEIDKSSFAKNGVAFWPLDSIGNELLRVWAELYGLPAPQAVMRDYSDFTTFALQGDPNELRRDYVKFKIFHDDANEHEEYFELYLHINLKGKCIAINEKDPEYRAFVIKGLSKKSLAQES